MEQKRARIAVSHSVSKRDDTRQQSDKDVRVHAPFMSLVYDDHAVSFEQEILRKHEKPREKNGSESEENQSVSCSLHFTK